MTAAPDPRAALWDEARVRPSASLPSPSLVSPQPLRPLPGDLLARLESRRRLGLDDASEHPRQQAGGRAVGAPATLALVALVVTVIGFAAGHDLLGLVAAVVTVVAAAGGVAGSAWVRADPLRVSPDERRTITAARRWRSQQRWTGELLATPERALVDLAVEAADAVVTDPGWTSGYLDAHRLTLDLAGELDRIDEQAFSLAQARLAGGAEGDVGPAQDALADRVLAVRRYRAGLAELTTHIAAADRDAHAAPAIGELRGAVQQSEFAVKGIDRLTDELTTLRDAVDRTAADTRRDDPPPTVN